MHLFRWRARGPSRSSPAPASCCYFQGLLYSLIRARIVSWYPWPFLNANENSHS